MIEQFFDYKNNTDEPFIPLPTAKHPRVLLPVKNRFYFRKGFQIHNTSSLKNRIIKALFIVSYPLGTWIQKQRLYAKPVLNDLIAYVKEKNNIPGEMIVSAYLGSSGKNKKITLQFMDSKGFIVGYLKLGNNQDNKKYIQNEYEIIEHVKKQTVAINIPENTFLEEWNDYLLLFQKSVPVSFSSVKNELNAEVLSALIEMAGIRGDKKEWKPLVRTIKREFYRNCETNVTEKMKKKIEKVIIHLGKKKYSPILTHGDFVAYNIKKMPDGLYLYDWEFAEKEGLPFYDVFHFVFQGMFQIRKMNVAKIIRKYILNHQLNQVYFQQYADVLSIQKEDILKFFLLYLIKGFNFDLYNRPNQNITDNHYFRGIQFMAENVL